MKTKLDIIRLCRAKSIPHLQEGHHHCHQGWVQLNCPWCGPAWTLGFSLQGGNFNCWRCGPLSTWEVLGRLLNTSDKRAIGRALHEFGVEPGAAEAPRKPVTRKRAIKPPPLSGPLKVQHRRYLIGRRFDPSHLAEEWDLTGTTYASGLWSWRIIIPVHDVDGRIVAYQGRTIRDVKPKYKMTEDENILVDPLGLLYGLHKVPGRTVIVVEGVTGAWRLGPGTTATFGIDWKVAQANILRGYDRRFILFDPEPKAQKRAHELARWLSFFPGTTEVVDGFRTDPGDFSPRQARRIVRSIGL